MDAAIPLKEELVEILVEELSMKNLLLIILPQILPEGYAIGGNCFVRVHEGKQDLHKQLPSRVRAYQYYNKPCKVIVIQDQDSNNCIELKQKIQHLIVENAALDNLIRIACYELEAWYIGDLDAIEKVYSKFKAVSYKNKVLFRNPDTVVNPSVELKRLIPPFQKGLASKEIPKFMNIQQNRSVSFNHLVNGIIRFLS